MKTTLNTNPNRQSVFTCFHTLFLLAILFIPIQPFAQLCSSSVVPPAVVNGITVTSTFTGGVDTYAPPFTSCSWTTPANSLYVGFGGTFTYTFLFSQPVNNVVFVMTASGSGGNEEFTFTTNAGIPDLIDLGSCFSTITGNVLLSGGGSGAQGGGGVFEVSNPSGPYTSLTLSGPGGLNGSLFALCEASVLPSPSNVTTTNTSCFDACDGTATISTGSLPPYTFQWDAAAGNATTATVSGLCAGTYSVEVTDGNGTTEVLVATITEPTEVQGSVSTLSDVSCSGLNDGSVSINASGGTGTLNYDIGTGPNAAGTFSNLAAGNYTATITDASGCSGTVPFTIAAPDLLALSAVTLTNPTCPSNDNGSIEVIASGGSGTYTYTINGASPTTTGVFQNLVPGTYTITVSDANACTSTADYTLTGITLISVDEIVTNEFCSNDCNGSIDLVVTSGTAPYSYSIDNCVTSAPSGTFTGLCSGAYSICITDAAGCTYTNTLTVGVENPASNPAMTPIGPLCANDDAIAIDAVDIGVLSGNGIVGNSFDPQVAGAGTHTITNSVTAGCGGTVTMDIIVYPLPVVSFIASETANCTPLSVSFSSTGDPAVNYQWSFGDGFHPDNTAVVDYTYTQPGYFDVLLITTDANGCSNSASYTDYIHALEVPTANFAFEPQKPTSLNSNVDFTNLSEQSAQWEWEFDTLGTSFQQHPDFTFPDESGAYLVTLIAISSDGCRDTIRKPVMIFPEPLIFVPNTFTPDGNEFNQYFLPSIDGVDTYHYHLTIYNRWGELVFESFDPTRGWDGTYLGRNAQEGMYNWHIVLDEIYSATRSELYGNVVLMR